MGHHSRLTFSCDNLPVMQAEGPRQRWASHLPQPAGHVQTEAQQQAGTEVFLEDAVDVGIPPALRLGSSEATHPVLPPPPSRRWKLTVEPFSTRTLVYRLHVQAVIVWYL